MRVRSFLVLIALGTFAGSLAGLAVAGGIGHSEGRMEMHPAGERTAVDVPILAPTDYLEWVEINEGIETGSLTAPGVEPTVGRTETHAAGEQTAVDVPILAPTDYVEWLEINEGIETGSLTAPGVAPTVFPGPSEPVEVPEGG